MFPGLALGADTPYVVPLVGKIRSVVYHYFKGLGRTDSKFQDTMNDRDIWYGIVKGLNLNEDFTFMVTNRKSRGHEL